MLLYMAFLPSAVAERWARRRAVSPRFQADGRDIDTTGN